jgi:hypothetical protein
MATYVVQVTYQLTVLEDTEDEAIAGAKQAVIEGLSAATGGVISEDDITAAVEGWV